MNSRARFTAGGISLLIYLVIFLLSSLPASSLPTNVPDFIPHFLEYFALAFFFIQVFPRPGRWSCLAAAFLALTVLGILDEWHQLSVPGRFFSLLDWLYDIGGALAGLAAFRILGKRLLKDNCTGMERRFKFLLLHR
ncbi:MAG TPA: VanZ family protein [Patescibacteria group bacterium]|nr:VanZ family protein [Patescibacteria group bacterium]